jgi:nucleotide-binding universal stress UspA family protein
MPKLEHILCPVDFSETSGHAFRYAVLLAEQFGARLTVLHVIEEAPLFAGFESMPAMNVLEEAEQAARRQLEELAAGAPARVETMLIRGGTYKSIVSYAEEHAADLIVMGTHGRSGLEYAFFGSVTERVMRRSPCPVLIVPPPKSGQEERK